ncbi:MAG TPA: M56 family metallopeptidase [Chitinophagaceae bacterium]
MPLLIPYLLKLFISLGVVWLFYQLVLRRLTFYNANRWYLLGFSFLAFFVPFINITPVVNNDAGSVTIMQFIPAVQTYSIGLEEATYCPAPLWSASWNKWDWILLLIGIGVLLLMLRFLIRCFSFLRLRSRATLISAEGLKIYHVDDAIIPFSFGNSIFINSQQHTEAELQEIIRHEFIHVKQRHTIDILWAELLCMLNWYNPVAWVLKNAIRQNLEFIADHQVLENGVDKKQYQYLLLKVIGNNQFSIAQKFNFSSLKKRIAMMNKTRSARVHLLRFLFLLPVLAVILISFRDQFGNSPAVQPPTYTDTVPLVKTPNSKGYIINILGDKGHCMVEIKDRNGKLVEKLLLTDWNEKEKIYEEKYGEIPPPPPPEPPTPPTPPAPVELPGNVKSINVNNNKAKIILKDGKSEQYDLNNEKQKEAFEKKYGPILPPPPPPPAKPVIANEDQDINLSNISSEYEITNKMASLKLKNGTIEKYDLTNPEERSTFEKKYGKIISTNPAISVDLATVAAISSTSGRTVVAPVSVDLATTISADVVAPAPVSAKLSTTVKPKVAVSPAAPLTTNLAVVADDYSYTITGKEDILVTITKYTSKQQLEEFKQQMKAKGIDLNFDKTEYNAKGILVAIKGTMQSKDSQSNFSATDFNKLFLAMIRKGERTYFKVSTTNNKEVVKTNNGNQNNNTEPAKTATGKQEVKPVFDFNLNLGTEKKKDGC